MYTNSSATSRFGSSRRPAGPLAAVLRHQAPKLGLNNIWLHIAPERLLMPALFPPFPASPGLGHDPRPQLSILPPSTLLGRRPLRPLASVPPCSQTVTHVRAFPPVSSASPSSPRCRRSSPCARQHKTRDCLLMYTIKQYRRCVTHERAFPGLSSVTWLVAAITPLLAPPAP